MTIQKRIGGSTTRNALAALAFGLTLLASPASATDPIQTRGQGSPQSITLQAPCSKTEKSGARSAGLRSCADVLSAPKGLLGQLRGVVQANVDQMSKAPAPTGVR